MTSQEGALHNALNYGERARCIPSLEYEPEDMRVRVLYALASHIYGYIEGGQSTELSLHSEVGTN
jgi:hypothetical protein